MFLCGENIYSMLNVIKIIQIIISFINLSRVAFVHKIFILNIN